MVWNNAHKISGFGTIYTKDLHDFNEHLRESFSILDCILDQNKAKQTGLKKKIQSYDHSIAFYINTYFYR